MYKVIHITIGSLITVIYNLMLTVGCFTEIICSVATCKDFEEYKQHVKNNLQDLKELWLELFRGLYF